MSFSLPSRRIAALVVTAALAFAPALAEARVGGGVSQGSRGSRTFSAPATTNTAPRPAAPMERTVTAPTRPIPATPAAQPQKSGFFRSMLGGLAGGLLGLSLAHMLFGGGMLGGIGLILQIILMVWLARMAWSWFANRRTAAFAGPQPVNVSAYNAYPGATGGSASVQPAPQGATALTLSSVDLDQFETLLGEIQDAWTKGDVAALTTRTTPEMRDYFAEQLAANHRRGLVNRITDVRLVKGDTSEAWREGNAEYATVAMRFSMIDVMVEEQSGKVVEGNPERPVEATELWTFVRQPGSGRRGWILSAIQQS